MANELHPTKAPVIDLFTGQPLKSGDDEQLVRIAPDYGSTSMLYGNDANPGKIFKLPIIGWGLQHNGTVVGLVPWLNCISACPSLRDPLNGHWEGYFNNASGDVLYEPPPYKVTELQAAHHYHCQNRTLPGVVQKNSRLVIQEIPDQIGTHAVFTDSARQSLHVRAIFSWQLFDDGHIDGMLIDPEKIQQTPVLAGDDALYSVNNCADFKYFFQYDIANKIKSNDPDAIKAISALIEG